MKYGCSRASCSSVAGSRSSLRSSCSSLALLQSMVTAMPRRPSVARRIVSLAGSMAPRSAWPRRFSVRSCASLPPASFLRRGRAEPDDREREDHQRREVGDLAKERAAGVHRCHLTSSQQEEAQDRQRHDVAQARRHVLEHAVPRHIVSVGRVVDRAERAEVGQALADGPHDRLREVRVESDHAASSGCPRRA